MLKREHNTTCPVCGTSFYRYRSQINRNRDIACSRICAGTLRQTGTTENCKQCSEPFYRRKSLKDRGLAIFCSRVCEVASRPTNVVECVCIQCSVTFKKDHWTVKVKGFGKFCCRACSDKYKRKLRKRGEKNMFTNWQKREWLEDKCAKCGLTNNLELDHIMPRFAGGTTEKDNAQTLCRTCNRKKFWTDDYPMYQEFLAKRVESSR